MKNKFLDNKKRVIMFILVLVIIMVSVVLIFLLNRKNDSKFKLDPIYDVYPDEIRNLYTNMVNVSCLGDLYFNNLKLDEPATKVENLDNNNLLNYLFSYLEKEEKLTDNMSLAVINNASEELLATHISFENTLNNFHYGDYIYNFKDNTVNRKKNKCTDTIIKYISQLYGYSYNEEILSLDVNIGYLKDGYLYDFDNNNLGEYDGDLKKLSGLFITNSYYRYNFILDGNTYKLYSVEWLSKS